MNKILLLALIFFLILPVVSGHDPERTLSFSDLNLQQHELLVYYSNGSLVDEVLSNESMTFNTTESLNVHIIPRRMDIITAGGRFEDYLWGYAPMLFFIFIILGFIGVFLGLSYAILTGRVTH